MIIVKVESSQGSLNKNIGCEKAPDKILESIKEIYLNEKGEEKKYLIKELKLPQNNIEETNEILENVEGDIFLGGDHSITYPLFKSLAKNHKNPGLIIFDAHPDCENNFQPPTHEDFNKVLIENNILKKENLILVGTRNFHKKEMDFIKSNKIKNYSMNKLENIHEICDLIMEEANRFDALYLSIDIDVLDPAFAPGTGYPEPGGLTTRQLIYFIQRIKNMKNLKRMDLVEVNPDKDINNLTVKTASKILMELL